MSSQPYRLRVLVTVACSLALLLSLQGCSSGGYDTSREAAEAWSIGVVSDDVPMVSDALGRDATSEEVAAWREDVLGLSTTYEDVAPGLGLSYEDGDAASYVLESITVDGETIYSDGAPLMGAFVFVSRDRGWHVIEVMSLSEE